MTSSSSTASDVQPVSFTVTVSATDPSFGTPTGIVIFTDGTTALGSATLDASGQASVHVASLAVGPHAITALYAGDANFASTTSAALVQTVNLAGTTTVLTSSASSSLAGQMVSFTVTVSSADTNSIAPTGDVTLMDGSTALGSASLDDSGQVTFATPALSVGAHSLTAVYGGDAVFTGSNSDALTQTVNAWDPSTENYTANPSIGPAISPSALGLIAALGTGDHSTPSSTSPPDTSVPTADPASDSGSTATAGSSADPGNPASTDAGSGTSPTGQGASADSGTLPPSDTSSLGDPSADGTDSSAWTTLLSAAGPTDGSATPTDPLGPSTTDTSGSTASSPATTDPSLATTVAPSTSSDPLTTWSDPSWWTDASAAADAAAADNGPPPDTATDPGTDPSTPDASSTDTGPAVISTPPALPADVPQDIVSAATISSNSSTASSGTPLPSNDQALVSQAVSQSAAWSGFLASVNASAANTTAPAASASTTPTLSGHFHREYTYQADKPSSTLYVDVVLDGSIVPASPGNSSAWTLGSDASETYTSWMTINGTTVSDFENLAVLVG